MEIKNILENIDTASEDDIEKIITASNLCRCLNPVTISFEVSHYQFLLYRCLQNWMSPA